MMQWALIAHLLASKGFFYHQGMCNEGNKGLRFT